MQGQSSGSTLRASTAGAGAVVAGNWARLEDPRRAGAAMLVAALAIAPALVRGRRLQIPAVLLAAVVAARIAFHVTPLHPRHYFGTLGSRFPNRVLHFYHL